MRPGYADIQGLDNLIDFYKNIRRVGSGKHIVNSIFSEDSNWIVLGEFVGIDKHGQNVKVEYCDCFHAQGTKFISRQTFFHVPHI